MDSVRQARRDRVDADEELVTRLVQRAHELASQRTDHSTGPLWYDTMLPTFIEVASGAGKAAKAQQLIQLAAGDRRVLARARRQVLDEGDDHHTEQAAELLTEALLAAGSS
jgi:hypothetical protein